MKRRKLASMFFAVAVLASAPAARAVDGVIQINDAAVKAAGGYPFKITGGTNSGSYRLTGNLTAPLGTDGIDVTAPIVTIDLNGFSISGNGSVGINAAVGDVTVENGTITGFATGVNLGKFGIVRNVHADANGSGISVGDNSVVEDCTANNSTATTGAAISCTGVCVISRNTASGNAKLDGIECVGNGCLISGNTANANTTGIHCLGSGCLISGNTMFNNATGISASDTITGYTGNVLKNTTDIPMNNGTSIQATSGNGLYNLCSGSSTPC
jgi:parallel beta-helix repeat protein